MGAESHRTAGSSRCSAGTQASTSTTRPPSSTAYTTRPNHPPPRCAHSASRPGHRPWSPGRPLTQQCRAPAARSRPTPDNADRSASVRPSRLDVIPPATAPACQLSNTSSHKNRSNGYALAAIDNFYRSIGVGRPEVEQGAGFVVGPAVVRAQHPGGVHPLRRPAHHRGHPARPARSRHRPPPQPCPTRPLPAAHRDRNPLPRHQPDHQLRRQGSARHPMICLLYTSDAADEEDSVDLGGRRIIKKKKKEKYSTQSLA